MDLTRTRFQEIYKSRALRFGTSVQPASLSQRVGNLNQQRRISRHTVMMAKRKINEEILTPIASPVVHPKKRKSQVVVQDEEIDDRLELLRKWQEETRKRLQQQKATKKFDLDSVSGQIKGKAVAASAKPNPAQPMLAPSPTYKFRAPANIKPINMKTTNTAKTHIPKMKAEIVPSDRVTRSKKPLVSPPALQLPIRTRQRLNFQDVGTTKTGATKKVVAVKLDTKIGAKQENIEPTSKLQQNKPKRNTKKGPINLKSTEDEENLANPLGNHNGNPDIVVDDVFVLEDSGSPVYVSPYVTMCRGKEAARKEYHRRSPQGGADDSDKSTSPQAAASYFRNLLTRQTERFEQLREQWNIYKNEQKPPEGACEMIDVAAGQTNLLITNKFQEFKGLLESCRRGDSEKPVTCVDLHQFWDKVLSQVAKLDKRFENLERLKASGWEDILPIAKPRQPNTSSSSLLGAVIQEARKKKAAERPSSAEVLPTDSPPNNDRTGESPKSILKTDRSKSQGRKPKVVFFKEMSIGDENQENNQNSPNMFFSPPGGAKRRSGRLAQQKK